MSLGVVFFGVIGAAGFVVSLAVATLSLCGRWSLTGDWGWHWLYSQKEGVANRHSFITRVDRAMSLAKLALVGLSMGLILAIFLSLGYWFQTESTAFPWVLYATFQFFLVIGTEKLIGLVDERSQSYITIQATVLNLFMIGYQVQPSGIPEQEYWEGGKRSLLLFAMLMVAVAGIYIANAALGLHLLSSFY